MHRTSIICVCLFLALAGAAAAKEDAKAKPKAKASQAKAPQEKAAKEKDKERGPGAKQLSGMSIVGNDEAPKSLYIVPWKRSEIGAETGMYKRLSESAVPVEREEFMRQLDLYESSAKK